MTATLDSPQTTFGTAGLRLGLAPTEHIPNRFPFDEKTGLGSVSEFWIYGRR
jgi:hypothetical protein